jgi:hypothetical protein
MMSVGERACLGLYADRKAIPDVWRLAGDVGVAIEELLTSARRAAMPPGFVFGNRPLRPQARRRSSPVRRDPSARTVHGRARSAPAGRAGASGRRETDHAQAFR